MGKFIDMTGWVMAEHGVPDSRLTVIGRAEDYISPSGYIKAQWLCECSCPKHTILIAMGSEIKEGSVKSCGCLNDEKRRINGRKNKKYNSYHFDGDIVIGLTSNTNKEFFVDLKNFDKIKNICWREEIDDGFSMLKGYDPITKHRVRMHSYLGFNNCDHIDKNDAIKARLNAEMKYFKEFAPQRDLFEKYGIIDNNGGGTQ